ncbi:MAG: YidC/Oxa1 family membrane protein insertase [Treponema sp.]|jgi:YidC/Oxa1 family membrane protein insertase|nr:YidC/Oxa1 family membrane protein insertase [Treponema sp.]
MTISAILYTLTIWPIRAVIEFLFVFFNRTFYDAGLGIIFLSFAVNSLLLPIYTVADRWQQEERLLQNKMKKKLADIKAVFRGDERQMIINTYYRQMGYSPLSALKSSIGLLLQIPFFVAAYNFLSHTPSILGESFWFLKDLGESDGLLRWGTITINVMPLIMTGINIISALVYTRDLDKRDKIQLLGMALLFLVLLYQSPSGLVLYWTCNNIFSLGKNAASAKLKHPGRALQGLSSLAALVLFFGALSGYFDIDRYTYLFAGLGLGLFLAPFIWKGLIRAALSLSISPRDKALLYFSSAALLALVMGGLIPAQVIASSVADFAQPWDFFFRTALQGIAFFILVPVLIWAFAGTAVKTILAVGAAAAVLLSLICLFALNASYGLMTNSFKIEEPHLIASAFPFWVNLAALLAALAIPVLFVLLKKRVRIEKIFTSLYNATAAAVLIMIFLNIKGIAEEAPEIRALRGDTNRELSAEVFPFTRSGSNTFVMFLDRAIGIAMHRALELLPELTEGLDGFTWYQNTLSFGGVTVTALPPLLGGYDYMPVKIDARQDELLKDKVNEAITLLPKIFGEAGYRVSVTDPSMTNLSLVPDLSVFAGMKNVKVQNLDGRLNRRFMEEFAHQGERLIDSFDFDILFRYGLFRIALPALRYGIHYKGTWWRDGASNVYGHGVTEYSTLYYLGDLCKADEGADTLNIFYNETTHEPGAYTADLLPKPGPIRYSREEIARFGSEDNTAYMYTFMAAMKGVLKWLEVLKDKQVYDNTRIIIVSDHGSGFENSIFEEPGMESYNPLLLVKEPGARGNLQISEEFMTNADVPSLITVDWDKPLNPYRGTVINAAAKNEVLTVVDEVSFQPRRHGPYQFSLRRIREFTGRNIFKAGSWGEWRGIKK